MMRLQATGILCLFGGLLLLWAGCCSEQGGAKCASYDGRLAADGRACKRDTDCRSGFCDRRTCAVPEIATGWNYGGMWCKPGHPPRALEDIRVPPAERDMCNGYVCIDRRCR